MLSFPDGGEASDYRHQLDLDRAIVTTSYTRDGVLHRRETASDTLGAYFCA